MQGRSTSQPSTWDGSAVTKDWDPGGLQDKTLCWAHQFYLLIEFFWFWWARTKILTLKLEESGTKLQFLSLQSEDLKKNQKESKTNTGLANSERYWKDTQLQCKWTASSKHSMDDGIYYYFCMCECAWKQTAPECDHFVEEKVIVLNHFSCFSWAQS